MARKRRQDDPASVLNEVALSGSKPASPVIRKRRAPTEDAQTPKKRRTENNGTESADNVKGKKQGRSVKDTTGKLGRPKILRETAETTRPRPSGGDLFDYEGDSPGKGPSRSSATSAGANLSQADTKRTRAKPGPAAAASRKIQHAPQGAPEQGETLANNLTKSPIRTRGGKGKTRGRPPTKKPTPQDVVPEAHERGSQAQREAAEVESDNNDENYEDDERVSDPASTQIQSGKEGAGGEEGAGRNEDKDQAPAPTQMNEKRWQLLGQDRRWGVVLKAAQVNERCQSGGIQTKAIKKVNELVKKAITTHEDFAKEEAKKNGAPEQPRIQLLGLLKGVEECVKGLDEKYKAQEAKQDAYMYAVPNMVTMLQQIFDSLKSAGQDGYSLNNLEMVLLVQSFTTELCKKIKAWKGVKVLTKVRITKSIESKVYPNLRDMMKVFETEKNRQNTEGMRRQDQQMSQAQDEMEDTPQLSQQNLEEDFEQRKQEINRNICEDILREREKWRSLYFKPSLSGRELGSQRQVSSSQQQMLPAAQWTSEEDDALLEYILSKLAPDDAWCALPCKTSASFEPPIADLVVAQDRYLYMLNTEALQCKLPEVVRNRLLYFKPHLEEILLSRRRQKGEEEVVPEWLHTLE